MDPVLQLTPRRSHLARLMSIWRSAGWPSRDAIELDLLAAGWVAYAPAACGKETLQVTEAGLRLLVAARRQRQASLSPHARLVERVCTELVRAGRIVWRELNLRSQAMDVDAASPAAEAASGAMALGLTGAACAVAPAARAVTPAWPVARPDVFSVRRTSVEAYLHPVVHEVKVRRADLLSDLRNAGKGAAYRGLSCETYYVFPRELAKAEEIPEPYGVWLLDGTPEGGTVEIARLARRAPCKLSFAVWMALAKATPVSPDYASRQRALGEPTGEDAAAAASVVGTVVPLADA